MGLRPADFWALSLTEWRALAQARFGAAPSLGRAEFESLMQLYPDV